MDVAVSALDEVVAVGIDHHIEIEVILHEGLCHFVSVLRMHVVVGSTRDNKKLALEILGTAQNRTIPVALGIFTKQYDIVNNYLEHHRLPKNMHLIFSAWKGLEMPNPYNLPEAHVMFRDGTTTASDGAKFCSGNCTVCSIEKKGCWTLQKGSQILFAEH